MSKALRIKKLVRSWGAVLLAVILLGIMLSGCRKENSQTEDSSSEAIAEPTPEPTQMPEEETGGEPEETEEQLVLEYNSGGDTPTVTTVIFHLNKGTVEVNALASSMYELSYESTYTINDGGLVIDDVNEVTATDISGVAAIIGLPEELTGAVIHVITGDEKSALLKIEFGDPANPEENAALGEFELDEAMLAKLKASVDKVKLLLHKEYASEKKMTARKQPLIFVFTTTEPAKFPAV